MIHFYFSDVSARMISFTATLPVSAGPVEPLGSVPIVCGTDMDANKFFLEFIALFKVK